MNKTQRDRRRAIRERKIREAMGRARQQDALACSRSAILISLCRDWGQSRGQCLGTLRQGSPKVHHARRRDIEKSSTCSNPKAFRDGREYTTPNIRWDWGATSFAPLCESLRLTVSNGLGQFRSPMGGDQVEDRGCALIGVNSLVIETKADTMISEQIEDFEKISGLPTG
jgi:hypothetical protein